MTWCTWCDFQAIHGGFFSSQGITLFLASVGKLTSSRKLGSSSALRLGFALCLQAGRILGKLFDERQEFGLARNVFLENLGHVETIRCLVVLKNTAQSSLSGAESGVESMDVCFLVAGIGLLLLAESDFELAGLVVGAVGARNELLVLTLERKPGLEIVLLGGSVVECARHNGNNLVGKTKRLVKFLGSVDHTVEVLPGLFRLAENELFNLKIWLDSRKILTFMVERTFSN